MNSYVQHLRKRLISFLISCLAWVSVAQAHNVFFLPGDSLFATTLTRQDIAEWGKSESGEFTFKYARLEGTLMACGNLGYSTLQLSAIDPQWRLSLLEAYWRFTETPIFMESSATERYQLNKMVVLIYNADFNGKFGLKFNEDWPQQGVNQCGVFFKAMEPVIVDWRDATKHAPLKLMPLLNSKAHLKDDGSFFLITEPIKAPISELKFVIVGHTAVTMDGLDSCPVLQSIFDSKEGAKYLIVQRDGFTEWNCGKEYKWGEKKFPVPLPENKSLIPKNELKAR